MRIISQDGTLDLPYENIAISRGYRGDKKEFYIFAHLINCVEMDKMPQKLATYSTESKTEKAMEMLRTAYTGRFVTIADIQEDFNERLQELMKGGFGVVIVKDTNDSRVEFDNLNGYFQFPSDEEVV